VTLLEQVPWGRLPAALRGTAVAVSADYPTLRQTGLLTIAVQTSPEQLDAAERIVLAEIAKLRESPPTAAELEGTKRILTGLYVVDNETFEGQAYSLGYYAAIDRWQFASSYLESIRKVTAEQVRDVAARYFAPERAVSILMRSGAEGEPPVEERKQSADAGRQQLSLCGRWMAR
jgi:predicted Zn-dependent peptidase